MEIIDDVTYTLYQGNSVDMLKQIPDNSVNCCITSPPYYGLRDYGTGKWVGGDENCPHRRLSKWSDKTITGHAQEELRGNVGDAIYKTVCPLCGAVRVDKQIGLEETPEQYIERLVEVFREVKRTLRDDGVLWVNIGDTYNASSYRKDEKSSGHGKQGTNKGSYENVVERPTAKNCKPKDLIGIPWMLAFALRNDGWYLRQDIIWCLSGGTYLYVKSQRGVQPMLIKDMVRLDPKTVQLWNGERWVNVLGWGKSPDTSRKIEIELRSGERIQCTGGHKWVLEDGTEKKASELSVGDVLMSARFSDEGVHCPSMLTKDLLWLIGLYIAEGSLSQNTIQIALNANEFVWVDRIRNAVKSVGGTVTHTIDGNKLAVRIYSQVFFAILHQYVGGKTAKNKHLNNICWQMSNESLKHLIGGYFDGDGNYDIENNRIRLGFTRNYDWERDLRLLANRLGATITLKLSESKCGDKTFPSFRGEWRWEQSDHHNNKNRNEIVAIRSGKGKNYYDISVDCDNHLFALASGVLTHNCKINPMPEPVKDRCTKSHEYIFMLTKKPHYWFDYKAIQEDAVSDSNKRKNKQNNTKSFDTLFSFDEAYDDSDYEDVESDCADTATTTEQEKESNSNKRNKRDVWTTSVGSQVKESHFATYPKELIITPVLASCPEGGTVLDPFNGSGTTGVVALNLCRNYIGIDLKKDYLDITKKRIVTECTNMLVKEECTQVQEDKQVGKLSVDVHSRGLWSLLE